MKMNKAILLGISSFMMISAVYANGRPNPYEGTYFNFNVGASLMPAIQMTDRTSGQVLQPDSNYSTGYDVGLAVGYRFESNFRTELAFSYIDNPLRGNHSNTVNNSIASGAAKVYALFANGYYNFETTTKFEPYLGAGIGYVDQRYTWTFNPASSATEYKASPGAMGFQGIAGLAYRITPALSIVGDYHYLFSLDKTVSIGNSSGSLPAGTNTFNYATNLVNVGFIYQF